VTAISPETRFDAAYKAIMQTALAALMAHAHSGDREHGDRPIVNGWIGHGERWDRVGSDRSEATLV
jgi:hypothetical protein